jgi:hypothetical protein
MMVVYSRYATVYNNYHKRRGQVVMDRFKSIVIETEESLFKVMAYIDMNAVRAGIVSHPGDWEFSSFHYYAYGKEDSLIDPPECFLELSNNRLERNRIYLKMVEDILESEGYKKEYAMQRLFIGDPTWVTEKYKILKNLMREKRKLLKRFGKEKPPPIKIAFQ